MLIYTPKKAHGRIFVIEGSVFVREMLAKQIASYGAASLYIYHTAGVPLLILSRYQGLWITFVHVLNAPPHTPRNYFPILSLSVGIDLDS